MNKTFHWGAVSSAVLSLCFISYFFADTQAASWLHSQQKTSLIVFFSSITRFGQSEWYLVPGLMLFLFYRKSNYRRAQSGLFVFASVAVSGLSADLLKYLLGRARPTLYLGERIYGFCSFNWEHDWTSFPSGHSATAFSAASVLSILYPRFSSLFFILAILIASSRIAITEHYISDVIAGSFLGIASTSVLYNYYFKRKFDTIGQSCI